MIMLMQCCLHMQYFYCCMERQCIINLPYIGKLPDSVKAQTALKEFAGLLEKDEKLIESLSKTVDIKSPCGAVQKSKVSLVFSDLLNTP